MRSSLRVTETNRTQLYYGTDALGALRHLMEGPQFGRAKTFILTDSNTRRLCLPLLLEGVPSLNSATVLEVPPGEHSKQIDTACRLWEELMTAGADRNSVLVNLGGGVVSDLGGFVASGFKRGIACINIPTTLMGQVDAAIGGKTGVNFGRIKNQVGTFYPPLCVVACPHFLETLPQDHLRSGLAEMIKTMVVGDRVTWNRMMKHPVTGLLVQPVTAGIWQDLVRISVLYKVRLVRDDFRERNRRKILNFGHTVGHALESFANNGDGPGLLHGDAVALGMIAELYLSHRTCALPAGELESIAGYIRAGYPKPGFAVSDIPEIMRLMTHDKKSRSGAVGFTLLSLPGKPLINRTCQPELINEALQYVLTP